MSGSLLGSFDGLDFLQQEGSDNAGLNALAAEDTSVRASHSLVLLGESLVSERPELGHSVESLSAFAAVDGGARAGGSLLDVLHDHSGSGGADLADLVGLGVVAESASVCHSLTHLWLLIFI